MNMNISLPDGSIREIKTGLTGLDLAKDIGPGLAKAAIAVTVNGIQKDLSDPILEDSEVSIITIDSDEGLEIMRHTLTAQVLARAVKNLFPETKLAIGPTITDGFYYVPRIDRKIVEQYKDDLIVLSGNLYGEVPSKILNVGEHQAEEALLCWKNQFGEDHKISMEPSEFNSLVIKIRRLELQLGTAVIKPTNYELENKNNFRRFIVCKSKINKGEKITEAKVSLMRIKNKKNGLSPDKYEFVLGKIAKKNHKKDDLILPKNIV